MAIKTLRVAKSRTVTALYVDRNGPYPKLVIDWYDERRDARNYRGPRPIVAHPPCGPWSKLRHLSRFQDKALAPIAAAQVRRWGGVLEHPADSLLWPHSDLPRPWRDPDVYGGFTLAVNQLAWGHACSKPTWIYCVGIDPAIARAGIRTGGKATHYMAGSHPDLLTASNEIRRQTPIEFARWLIRLAEGARRE